MASHDRRGSRPGSSPTPPPAPWLKDRPDLHRAEEPEADLLQREPAAPRQPGERDEEDLAEEALGRPVDDSEAITGEGDPAGAAEDTARETGEEPVIGGDQRVIGGDRREGSQPPGGQGDATKARRRPS